MADPDPATASCNNGSAAELRQGLALALDAPALAPLAAELATATTVVSASGIGLPISTTHTLVGAVLGVGMARGIGALNLRVIGTIFSSWVITLPAGAALSIVFFFILSGIFG